MFNTSKGLARPPTLAPSRPVIQPCFGVRQPAQPACGQARARIATCASKNYYQILEVEWDASEDDIKAAFRRKVKELHPDVNKEDDAEALFMECNTAYETLMDPGRRRMYNQENRIRRANFFQDVVEDEDSSRPSPFRWSRVGRQDDADRMRPDDDESDSDEDEGADDDGDASSSGRAKRQLTPEEFLEQMNRFMGRNPGGLSAWQTGRFDPFGTSTSDSWYRQVEKQSRSPYGPSRPGYGQSDDEDLDPFRPPGRELDPTRRPPGWQPPGQEGWRHPRKQWDEEDKRGSGGSRGPGRGGDERRPFKL